MNEINAGPEGHKARTLETSPRFSPPPSRRDFLGLSAVWSAIAAVLVAIVGAMRLPMPAVFPESNTKTKIGPPDKFTKGSATFLPDLKLWIFRDRQGFHAISSVCTHLGCIVDRQENGEFTCPCHGSSFAPDGKVLSGPAPKGLNWLAMSLAPDGRLVVDRSAVVSVGTQLQA
ncbi:MAG: QcrA and Rieske domain-containing protein [Planctomycetota bacterium]|jgi:cytochrome b6-f complex iron-sulfur subunit